MTGELILRFLLGGVVVSLFAAAGELFKPKTFAGLFGAAPSVAIATLSIAYLHAGPAYVATEARSMAIGALALLVYGAVCVAVAKRRAIPVWLGAALGWTVWAGVALGAWAGLRLVGVPP